jgi:hypothetical protein
MRIEYEDVFDVLAEAVTDFKPSEAELEDRLSYPFLNGMVRFVCDRAYPEFESSLRQFADLFERLICKGDSNVHDLAHDALDALWEHGERELISGYFGPKTRELWGRICAGERGQ